MILRIFFTYFTVRIKPEQLSFFAGICSKVVLSGQIGIGSIPFIGGYSFPHKIIITLPAQKHVSLEIGVGGNYWMENFSFSSDSYYIYPLFGFRIDSDYHMLFRITFSPYVNIYGDNFFAGYSFPPSIGASVGYVFQKLYNEPVLKYRANFTILLFTIYYLLFIFERQNDYIMYYKKIILLIISALFNTYKSFFLKDS